MRVIEKNVINSLILQGEENLRMERDKKAGLWVKVYAPEIFNSMIVELETLRKELDERTIEI